MVASTRALMTGILDYAGLFPPAELPLERAMTAFVRQRSSPDGWMQARFVCPVAKLTELRAYRDTFFAVGEAVRFSLLTRGGPDAPSFITALAEDLAAASGFVAWLDGRASVDAFEARLPDDLAKSGCADSNRTFLDRAADAVGRAGSAELPLWLEAGFTESWSFTLPRIWEAMQGYASDANGAGKTPPVLPGFKLRCGGATPESIPSPEQVAFVITGCRDHGVPLKFTAGLHHPFRHADAKMGTKMHGFVNVFAAGLLAGAHGLGADVVREILEEEKGKCFVFGDDGLTWHGRSIGVPEIQAGRKRVASFGSCSFEEPRDDLRGLGLL